MTLNIAFLASPAAVARGWLAQTAPRFASTIERAERVETGRS